MNTLIVLIAAAFMTVAAIYLGQQGLRLSRANKMLRGIVAALEASKPFALTEPQQELAEAVKVIWAMAEDGWLGHGPEGMSEVQRAVCNFTLRYPKPSPASEESKP